MLLLQNIWQITHQKERRKGKYLELKHVNLMSECMNIDKKYKGSSTVNRPAYLT